MNNYSKIKNEIDRRYENFSFMNAYCYIEGMLWTALKFKLISEDDYYQLDNYSNKKYMFFMEATMRDFGCKDNSYEKNIKKEGDCE